MSWSVSGKGESDQLAANIEAQFESFHPCTEPEETLKQSARKLIAETLAANIPPIERTVTAYGSQSITFGLDGTPEVVRNTLSIVIT